MLPALVLLVSLAQHQAPAPQFMWNIGNIYERNMLVTVSPARERACVKAIALDPAPTPGDPKPLAIEPTRTEPTPDRCGLRAWFGPLRRRFQLNVTLSDGSTHKIDIYATRPLFKSESKPLRPYLEIAPRLSRT